MNVSLYQAAAALNANARWQEMIAENLAASSVSGFKNQEMSFAEVQAGLMPATAGGSLNGPRNFTLAKGVQTTSFLPGEMKHSDSNLDMGLQGPGFFEVQMPNGGTAYTRDGSFHLSPQGQLLTREGYTVMSESGPLQLDPSLPSSSFTVSSGGEVTQEGANKGKLKMVEFNDPQLLTPVSSGYFLPNNPALSTKISTDTTVQQNVLESSNTSTVVEMAKMMIAMRTSEANQRIIQTQDERMGKAISELTPG